MVGEYDPEKELVLVLLKPRDHTSAYLRQYPGGKATALQTALEPLLDHLPYPVFTLRWIEAARAWCSRFGAQVTSFDPWRRWSSCEKRWQAVGLTASSYLAPHLGVRRKPYQPVEKVVL
jgi:hypothetical protein